LICGKVYIKVDTNKIKVLRGKIMNAEERLLDAGYEGIKYLIDEGYDDALIGVSEDGRAIYDFDKMVDWLIKKYGWSDIESIEWIEFNTLRALPYMGSDAPIIMYALD
jgi:hypothetical protein